MKFYQVIRAVGGNVVPLLLICQLFVFCNPSTPAGSRSGDSSLAHIQHGRLSKKAGLQQAAARTDFDTLKYQRILAALTHNKPDSIWSVKEGYPLPGAITPFKRIVAYYGNLYSKGMGILGALPPDEMLGRLQAEVKKWEEADTLIPVQPALHYIAVTAQSRPGPNSTYRMRMPGHQIDSVLALARKINAIVFLDIQVGHSSLAEEIPPLRKYLILPDVHLGIDPEFSMKAGKVPGTSIGTFDAEDINYASAYLAQLVQENNIPPKVLVVHRFTQGMVTNYRKVRITPEVQIIMHMDGFGFPAKKLDTYKRFIAREPVQFTGFKVFYKNDVERPRWPAPMQPKEILELYPQPVYIQYQ
ncbi:MAG: hypothetical protein INR73_07170 [Williamsia sp.]|nr:hypothetical protein [Williamsia sp.]